MGVVRSAKGHDLVSENNTIFSGSLRSVSFLFFVLGSSPALAQHELHDMSNNAAVPVETLPANDEVSAKAPESLMLHFESAVRLVKLALKEPERGEINIDFRYSPVAEVHFMQSLPILAAAKYYRVEWAVLKADGELIKGNFYFSFGDGARPPSYYLNQIEHPDHIMSPDYRLL